jgi:hypothetical protein
LAFQGGRIWESHERLIRVEQQRREGAQHLQEQQREGRAHEQPGQQPQPDQALPCGQDQHGRRRRHVTQRYRLDGLAGERLSRAQTRKKLQDAEPEEDDAQRDAHQYDAVARHHPSDAPVDSVESGRLRELAHARILGR